MIISYRVKVILLCSVFLGIHSKRKRHFFNTRPDGVMDVTDFSIYYDLDTNQVSHFFRRDI